ncbi:MAG: hypothetical protein L7U25_00230, partial [Candidatus Poseidonia sp.]|nr:hypothetical protein [Poseidonia sp.]
MGFTRTVVGLLFVSVLAFYLSTVGQLTDEAKWGFVGAMGVLAFLWVNLGGAPTASKQRQRPRPQPETQIQPEVVVETEEEEEDDLPAPVVVNSLDGATLRERKLAKIAAAQAAQASMQSLEEVEVEIEVEIEDVHVADEYVVDVSPESVEDA